MPPAWTGSHTGENGGEYPRSMLATSSTVIRFQMATAAMSIRFAAPAIPTIWQPSMRPLPFSAMTLTLIIPEPGK